MRRDKAATFGAAAPTTDLGAWLKFWRKQGEARERVWAFWHKATDVKSHLEQLREWLGHLSDYQQWATEAAEEGRDSDAKALLRGVASLGQRIADGKATAKAALADLEFLRADYFRLRDELPELTDERTHSE